MDEDEEEEDDDEEYSEEEEEEEGMTWEELEKEAIRCGPPHQQLNLAQFSIDA